MEQIPSVGCIVHYFAYGTPGGEYPAAVARAAIITEVPDPVEPTSSVGLCVLNPTGQFFNRAVPYGPNQPGCWGWPPFVPARQSQAGSTEGERRPNAG